MSGSPARALSRAAALADGLMEAGWLVIAACLPAMLQGADLDLYESPKVWLLHVCAAVMLGAGLVRIGEGGWPPAWREHRVAAWTVTAALLYAAWSALSTLFAVAPIPGLFGIPSRGQGVLTDLAYVVVFVVVATFLRDRQQRRRLVSALVLGSAPVCALGLVEAAGFAPFPPIDPTLHAFPVRSTLGQHSFLAGYLLLVLPLTAARLLETVTPRPPERASDRATAMRAAGWLAGPLVLWALVLWVAVSWWGAEWWAMPPALTLLPIGLLMAPPPPRWLERAACVALLLAQLVVLAASQGRGPWLGFFVALLAVLILAVRLAPAWRRWLWPALALYCAVLLLVAVLNVPGGPLAPVKQWHPLLNRMGSFWETRPGQPGGVRLSIWKSVPGLFSAAPGAPSFVSPARLVIGYGRDSQFTVLPPVLEESMRAARWRDTTGRRALLVVDRAHNDVLDHLVTLGLVGVGLFLSVWLALGLVVTRLLQWPAERLYAGALGVALLAHGIELQTGVAITATRALFWLEAGLLVAMLGMDAAAERAPRAPVKTAQRTTRRLPVAGGALALALVLIAPMILRETLLLLVLMTAAVLGGIGWIALSCSPASATAAWRRSPGWLIAAAVMLATVLVALTGANFAGAVYAGHGREHVLQNDWLPAVTYYEHAVRLAPWQDSYWHTLGTAYLSVRTKEVARHDGRLLMMRGRHALEMAVWQNHAGAEARRSLAGLYAQAGAALDPDALARAERLYDESLALSPPSAQALAERAELALRRGAPADAARFADSAIAVDPARWGSYAVRARAARELGRPDEARRFVGEAEARVPPQERARLERYLLGGW